MKKYIQPIVKICNFATDDIVRTSIGTGFNTEENETIPLPFDSKNGFSSES